jgi:hypothetical protein
VAALASAEAHKIGGWLCEVHGYGSALVQHVGRLSHVPPSLL